jgi:hypothetical protein
MRGKVYLPGEKTSQPAPPFIRGAKVELRGCPGPAGVIVGVARSGRLLVSWADLNYLGRHKADSLVLVEDKSESK